MTATTTIRKEHNWVDDAMRDACMAVLDSHRYYMGPQSDAFEAGAAEFLGVGHAIAVNSGSSAMFLILKALGLGPGDEVIVPATGFVTLSEAPAGVGARVRYVEVEEASYNVDPAGLEGALTPAVKAVVPAHNFGHPADLDAVTAFARRHDLLVIEDCAHAFGAKYRDTCVGGYGVAGFVSFAGKSISVCGLGGMVLTNDAGLAREVRLLRDHGRPRSGGERFYDIQRIGYNMRLSELHAAVGRAQLPHLAAWNARRRENAAFYTERFGRAGVPLVCPSVAPEVEHAFLHYTVRVDAERRDGLKAHLSEHGIETSVIYPTPLYLLAPYRAAWGGEPGDFPFSDRLAAEVLSLPNHPSMTEAMLSTVVETVADYLGG